MGKPNKNVRKKISIKYYHRPSPAELYTDNKFLSNAHQADNMKSIKETDDDEKKHMNEYKSFADSLFGGNEQE